MSLLGCNSIFHGWEDAWQWLLGVLPFLPILVLRLRTLIGRRRECEGEEVHEEGESCSSCCEEGEASVTHPSARPRAG